MPNFFDQFDTQETQTAPGVQANFFDQFDEPGTVKELPKVDKPQPFMEEEAQKTLRNLGLPIPQRLHDTSEPVPGGKLISQMARPVLEGVGGAGGAIIGSGLGPLGTVAGGAGGFGIASEIADQFDEFLGLAERKPLKEELYESGRVIRFGAAAEMGGLTLIPALMIGKSGLQLAGKGTGYLVRKIPGGETLIDISKDAITGLPLTAKKVAEKAREILIANTSGGPVIAKNIDEARSFEKQVPGLKFSLGQLTDDPGIIKLERTTASEPGQFAAQKATQTAENTDAIRKFIDKSKGEAGLPEVVDPLTGQQKAVDVGVETAQKGLQREAVELGRGQGAVEAGQTIRETARAGKTTAREEAGKLFKEVPQFDIDVTSLGSKIDELSKPFSRVENVEKNIPGVFGRTKELLKETNNKLTPDDLQGIRTELTTDLRKVQGGTEPNKRMASRISGLIGEVDDVLKSAGETVENQAIYKGKTIYPDKLKTELDTINKKIETEPQFYKKEIDIDETYNRLQKDNVLGIMRQVQENSDSYSNRLAKAYKIEYGKDAPIKQAAERTEIKYAKQRKSEIEKQLTEAVPISTEKMEAAAKSLKTAQQFYKKEVIQKFEKGAVGDILEKGGDKISNAQVASKFFQPGAKGGEAATQFIDAVGDNQQARQAIEDAIKQDLLEKTINPVSGEIVESKLKGWLLKHNSALTKLGIKDKFNTVLKARSELDTAIDLKDQFNKSVASKLLKADADKAIQKAFGSGSKAQAAKELMFKMKGNKKGIAGLQNATIDHITSIPGIDDAILEFRTVAGLKKLTRDFKSVMDIMYKDSPEKVKALQVVRKAFDTMGRTSKSPIGGGSDTYEKVVTGMAKNIGMSNSAILNIVKFVLGPIKSMSDKQVNTIINRALLDPDFAFTLMNAAKGMPADMIERRLKGHLSALGIRHSKQEKEKK